MTKSGFHIASGSRMHFKQVLQACWAAGHPVACIFSVGQDVWPDVRDTYPNSIADADLPTTVVFRSQVDASGRTIGDAPGDMYTNPNPEAVAIDWMGRLMPKWRQNKAHYHAPINEQDGGPVKDMTWLNRFALKCMQVADENGFKLALPACSTGNPRDDPVSTAEDRWHELLPAMAYAKAHGHILILHEYGLNWPGHDNLPTGTLQNSAPYMALRHRRALAYLLANNAAPRVMITEASPQVGIKPALSSLSKTQVLADMKWYDLELQRYGIVIGCCWYGYGGAENLENIALDMSQQMSSLPDIHVNEVPYGQGADSMFGLHGRSGSDHREADWLALRKARPTVSWYKLITNTNVEDISRVIMEGIKPEQIVMRLHFATQRPERVTPTQFVDWQMIHLTRFNALHGKYVEVHNEPNLEQEGLGTQWSGPNEFSAWFNEVQALIKQRFPDLLVGMPGLSPKPNVAEWLVGCASAYRMCDWIGVHCYFIDDAQMADPEHGSYWRRFTPFMKPIIITEFSNPSPDIAKNVKARQYLYYVASLHPYQFIKAAICFTVSNAGFDNEAWVSEAGELSPIPEIVGAGAIVAPPPPNPPPTNLDSVLWDKSIEWQTASGIQLNAKAALQQEIRQAGMWPVTTELYLDNIAYMAAEDITGTKPRRVYVWQNGQVRWFTKP